MYLLNWQSESTMEANKLSPSSASAAYLQCFCSAQYRCSPREKITDGSACTAQLQCKCSAHCLLQCTLPFGKGPIVICGTSVHNEVHIMYTCATRMHMSIDQTMELFGGLPGTIQKASLVDWPNFYRAICAKIMLDLSIKMDGVGKIVEIDEHG